MKNLVIILTAFCAVIINSAVADAGNLCRTPKGMPEVNITTSYGKLTYNTKLSTAQITKLAGAKGYSEQGMFTSGLATINIGKEYSLITSIIPLDNGKACVYPAKINVYVGYSHPVIYISKDLSRGSCQYNLVVRHEQTHQRINKKALEYFLPKIKKAAQKIGKDLAPKKAANKSEINRITQDMSQSVAEKLDKIVAIFEKELKIEQSKLDNHQNYSMEDDLCRRFNQQSGTLRSKYNQ